jgi:hypothetical protein
MINGSNVTLFIFFVGMILIIHGIYQQKFKQLEQNVRVEYRFIPRTYYEEQISNNMDVSNNFKTMFQTDSWLERNVTLPKGDRTGD